MRRVSALLLACLLFLSSCAGGQSEPTPEPTPTPQPTQAPPRQLTLAYDPTASLHPITGTSQVNVWLSSLVYQGLYRLDETFAPQPVLVEQAQVSEDGLTWRITLKEGLCFSDGTPLLARQAASSLNTARKSQLYAQRLRGITSVRASGERVVVIALSAPNGNLPALLDVPVVLEQEEGPPLGTGRYRFFPEGESMRLVVNGNYEGELPFGEILLYGVSSAADLVAAFDSGAVDLVSADLFSPHALGYSGSYEIWDYPTADMVYVGFQTATGSCAQAQVRAACSTAFDREKLVEACLAGRGDAAVLPLSPRSAEYVAQTAGVGESEELLRQCGYTRGEDGLWYQNRAALTLTLIVNSDSKVKVGMAQRLAQDLAAVGITLTVKPLDWNDYIAALKKGEFDLYLAEVGMTGDFALEELLTGSLNYGGYQNEELALLLAQRNGAQGEQRRAAAALLWQTLVREAPIAPLCFKQHALLTRWGAVSGAQPLRGDLFHNLEQWKLK